MLNWKKRPTEVANLLNPAFCSSLLSDTIRGYYKETNKPLPYSLAFLVLPIILHKQTRDALPRTITTKHHAWLEANQHIRINFSKRTRQIVPYTKEAIMFGVVQKAIVFHGEYLSLGSVMLKAKSSTDKSEVGICRKKAEFLGRWLAYSGDPSTIFLMWGICP